MEPRLSLVTLGVAEIARARRFYEALGWTASSVSNSDVVFFQLGGIALGLYGRKALAEDAKLTDTGASFGGITLAYNVRTRPEVDALLAEAARIGGRILKPAEEVFWGGYSGYFADLDGHPWEVAWNPGFPIAEDGAIQLPA